MLGAGEAVGVVFLGDSITEEGHFTALMEDAMMARHPAVPFSFHNAGTSGDRLGWRVDDRLDADVIEQGADVVIVQFGMNDGGYRPEDAASLDAFQAGLDRVLSRLQGRVVLVGSPSFPDPLGPMFSGQAEEPVRAFYPAVMRRYGEVARAAAGAAGAGFGDLLGPMEALTERARAGGDTGFTLVPDGIHPDEGGALVMADVLLGALIGAVADPIITLECAEGVAAGRAEVMAFPFRAATAGHPARAAFARRHTRTLLRVDCLAAGRHVLSADGERLGWVSAEALADGVDLAEYGESVWGRRVARWRAVSEARRALYAETIRPAMTAAKREAAGLGDPGARARVFRAALVEWAPALAEAARLLAEAAALAQPDGVWLRVAPAP